LIRHQRGRGEEQTADIFGKLQIERKRTPVIPLIEGKFV
jgi:hypothetical protein